MSGECAASLCGGERVVVSEEHRVGVRPELIEVAQAIGPGAVHARRGETCADDTNPEGVELFLDVAEPATVIRSTGGPGVSVKPQHGGTLVEPGLGSHFAILIQHGERRGRQGWVEDLSPVGWGSGGGEGGRRG